MAERNIMTQKREKDKIRGGLRISVVVDGDGK